MKSFPKEKILKNDNLLFAKWKTNSVSTKQFVLMQENAFVFVLKGKKILVQKKDIEVDYTQVLLIRKGLHKMTEYLATDGIFEALVIYFNADFIRYLNISDTNKSTQPFCDIDAIVVNRNKIIDSFINQYFSYFEENENDQSVLKLKVAELAYLLSKNNRLVKEFFISIANEQDGSLQSIMEKLYKENYNLEELASFTNRSLSKFKKDFEKIFHSTPAKWILNKKLSDAQFLLQNSDKNISEIAYECGFNSLSQFDKSFKQQIGVTPQVFRSNELNKIHKQ